MPGWHGGVHTGSHASTSTAQAWCCRLCLLHNATGQDKPDDGLCPHCKHTLNVLSSAAVTSWCWCCGLNASAVMAPWWPSNLTAETASSTLQDDTTTLQSATGVHVLQARVHDNKDGWQYDMWAHMYALACKETPLRCVSHQTWPHHVLITLIHNYTHARALSSALAYT